MSDVIYSINGSIVSVLNAQSLAMREMVYVGENNMM